MKKRILGMVLVMLMAFAVEAWVPGYQALAQDETKGGKAQTASDRQIQAQQGNPSPSPAGMQPPPGAMLLNRPDDTASKKDITTMFQADGKGNLVLNEKTRLHIEELSMLNTPEELKAKFEMFSKAFPAPAHRQLVRLTDDFKKYAEAVIEKYPPDKEPKTVKEAITQHEGIHDLRVQYFGADAANAFFGGEEKLSRRLMDIMETLDEKIPLPERAHMAQEILKKSMETHPRPVR